MNTRQQLYKKNRLSGMSAYQSAVKAGYSHATAIAAYKNIEKRINFDDALVKAGLDDNTLAKHAQEGLQATKVISANITYGDADEKTNDFIEVPDWASRHKYYDTILKLQNKLKDKPLIDNRITALTINVRELNAANLRA